MIKCVTKTSIIHVIIAIAFLFLGVSKLNGQSSLEIIAYRLVPSQDVHCQIKVEIIEPATFEFNHDLYKEEIIEILIDRAVYELTSPFAINEPFQVDDKFYQLVKIQNTGDTWYQGAWNHNE